MAYAAERRVPMNRKPSPFELFSFRIYCSIFPLVSRMSEIEELLFLLVRSFSSPSRGCRQVVSHAMEGARMQRLPVIPAGESPLGKKGTAFV